MEISLHLYNSSGNLVTSRPIETKSDALPRKGEVLLGVDDLDGKSFEVSEVGYHVSKEGFTGLIYVNASEVP